MIFGITYLDFWESLTLSHLELIIASRERNKMSTIINIKLNENIFYDPLDFTTRFFIDLDPISHYFCQKP